MAYKDSECDMAPLNYYKPANEYYLKVMAIYRQKEA